MDFDGLHYPCAVDRWFENDRSELADIRLTEQFKDFTTTEQARWEVRENMQVKSVVVEIKDSGDTDVKRYQIDWDP